MESGLQEALRNCLEPKLGKIKDIKLANTDKNLEEIIIVASAQVSIRIILDGDDKQELQLFLKICKSGSVADYLNKELYTFIREQYFYENIAPELKKSLARASTKHDLILEYYGHVNFNNDLYLIMEDFVKDGFSVTPKNEFHDLNLIKSSLMHLARFHSAIYDADENKRENWKKFLDEKETFSDKNFEKLKPFFQGSYEKNLKVVHAVATELLNNNELLKKKEIAITDLKLIEKLKNISSSYLIVFNHFVKRKNKFYAISHGDFHMWNIAAKKSDSLEVKFFDYQSPRFASVMNDILQYIYQVCTVEFRKSNLNYLLKCYVEEFNKVVQKNHPECIITLDELMEEYKAVSPWGFLYGFSFILPRYVNKEFYVKIDGIESSKEIVNLIFEQAISNEVWEKISLMMEMINEADHLTSIQIMEDIFHDKK